MPRSYSDQEIAQALAVLKSCGGNVLRASQQCGVPRKTLETWSKSKTNRTKAKSLAEIRQQKELTLANECEKVLWKLLKFGLAPKKIREASASQVATAFGVFTDKMRILRDQGPPPSEAAKTASEAIKQAAAALVELSKGTKEPLDLAMAEERMKQIQLQNAQLASDSPQ